MRGKRPCLLPLLLCCVVNSNTAAAQELSKDSLKNYPDLAYSVNLYYTAIGENAHIYNGYEYMIPDSRIQGNPYFLTDAMVPANISYDEDDYQNIPVLYDIVRDLLVINRLDQNYKISLVSNKLNSFYLQNHNFVRMSRDSLHGVELDAGFYDRVYAGKSTVLVKRRKIIHEILEYSTSISRYQEQDLYYVKFGGQWVEVDSKASVLKLFKSKKSEIKSFLRKSKLKFKSDFEKTLVAASAYYDQLTS
jgi:hypothetical protein